MPVLSHGVVARTLGPPAAAACCCFVSNLPKCNAEVGRGGEAKAQHKTHTEHYSKLPRFGSQVYSTFSFWYTCPVILFYLYLYTQATSGKTAFTNGSGIPKLWGYSPL